MSLMGLNGYAQTNVYHPFPDSGAVWMMQFTQYCELAPNFPYPHCTYDYQYAVKGDTLINGMNYKKIYWEELISDCIFVSAPNNYTCSAPVYYSFLFYFIRNDTAARKVYAFYNTQDQLIYDFSLNIGDTMIAPRCGGLITDIDSILIGGNYRKRFIVDGNGTGVGYWIIEGIGSVGNQLGGFNSGPFDGCGEVCACNIAWYFNCFIQSGIPLYPDTSTCVAINGINSPTNSSAKAIIVYPNPSNGIFTLSYHSSSPQGQINLMDVTGKIVFTQTLNGTATQQINATALRDGFYLYEVVSEDVIISTGKVVIMK